MQLDLTEVIQYLRRLEQVSGDSVNLNISTWIGKNYKDEKTLFEVFVSALQKSFKSSSVDQCVKKIDSLIDICRIEKETLDD